MTKDFFSQQLQLHGIAARSLENTPFIYGAISTGEKHTLLLYFQCHATQAADQEQHMYSTILTSLYTYYNTSSSIPVNLKWLIQTDVTVDHAQLDKIITQHHMLLQADACIAIHAVSFDEHDPLLALGTKGLLSVELTVAGATEPLPASYGAIAPNALWRLTWALSSLKDAREEILIDGFYDTLLPTEDDESALLHTLSSNTLIHHIQTNSFFPGLEGFQLHYTHLLTPTCTITSINGGDPAAQDEHRTTMLPTHAMARVDIHLVPEQDPHAIFQQLRQHLQARGFQDVQTRLLAAERPIHTALAHPFVQLARQATVAAYGREPIVVPLLPYSLGLAPLQQGLAIPVIIVPTGYHNLEQAVSAQVKQIALITEGQW